MWCSRFLLSAGLAWLCVVTLFHHVKANPTSDLQQVQREFFDWHMEQSPEFATEVGINTYNDCLESLTTGVFDTRLAAIEGFINRTQAIDRSQLNLQNQYTYDIFLDTLSTFTNNYVWRTYGSLNPITFLEGFYLDLDYIINITPFNTKGDFENFIARLEAYPVQIRQMQDRMAEAIRIGTTNHMVSVKSVPSQISKVVDTPVQQSTLYAPFNDTLDNLAITQTEKDDVRTRGQTALQHLWTSLQGLKTYFERTYFQHTRGSYGVGGLPEGGNYYQACLKWHLSVDMSPVQVHQKGLDEVSRIVRLMHEIINKQGFNGTIREYYNHLKADSRFHFSSAEEIMKAYEDLIYNRITPKLPQLFKNIPPNKVVVKPLSYDGPYGMYSTGSEDGSRPGTFYVNLFRPEDTSSFSMVSLTLHETVPGHHLQGIYQMAAQLPSFQKFIEYSDYFAVPYHFPFYTAYTEGWALYAEYLGEEMGVYADDYELMGRYSDEIFRACRLVVDTGLHFFGWSRGRAVQYLLEHTAMPDAEVQIEIDRYITWPGQACAYKIGELKIKELREKATTALGDQFDVRDFHSLLLDHGPVPLNVMENIVNDYIHHVHTGGSPIG